MAGLGIRIFTDEMVTPRLANELRRRGYDVESCRDAGRASLGISDNDQLRYCAAAERSIYTFNSTDFDRLDREWNAGSLPHAGIIVSEDLNSTFEQMVMRLQYHLDTVRPAMQHNRLLILGR